MFPQEASERRCAGGCVSRTLRFTTCDARLLCPTKGSSVRGFTLFELLIVVAIIALLLVLLAPAFTTIRSGTDVTSAAYTIKGVLDTARTYAKANNTYVWIGFAEEAAGSNPAATPTATPAASPYPSGRVVMAIVASKDGTTIYDPNSPNNPDPIDPTRLTAVTKLVKIENIHLPLFTAGTGTGDTFDSRPSPSPASDYNNSRFGELNTAALAAPLTDSQFPFQYPVGSPLPPSQYVFRKTLQFTPRGECRINSTYQIRRVVEIGLVQTRGTIIPTPTPSAGNYMGNVAAVQITGFGSSVKIYRR
jgi:prepilin-type N-terminal cleavage/methylation domain-containing protein